MKNAPYQKLHLYVRACASASIEYYIAEIYCIVHGIYYMEMQRPRYQQCVQLRQVFKYRLSLTSVKLS